MIQKKKICNATNGRLPWGRNREENLRGFTVVMCCEKRSSSVGVIMHVLSSESGHRSLAFGPYITYLASKPKAYGVIT